MCALLDFDNANETKLKIKTHLPTTSTNAFCNCMPKASNIKQETLQKCVYSESMRKRNGKMLVRFYWYKCFMYGTCTNCSCNEYIYVVYIILYIIIYATHALRRWLFVHLTYIFMRDSDVMHGKCYLQNVHGSFYLVMLVIIEISKIIKNKIN